MTLPSICHYVSNLRCHYKSLLQVVGVVAYAFVTSIGVPNGQSQKFGWNENFGSNENETQYRMTLPAGTQIGESVLSGLAGKDKNFLLLI